MPDEPREDRADPYRKNDAPAVRGPGAAFYRCPKCAAESYFSCPNCQSADHFTLEEGGARCRCDQVVQWAACQTCQTRVAAKFFFRHGSAEAEAAAKTKAQSEAATAKVLTWVVGIALLAGGYYGLKSCVCGGEEQKKPAPSAKASAAKPAAPAPAPKPEAGPFPKAPAERDVRAFRLVHRRLKRHPGQAPEKWVARRLKMKPDEVSDAVARIGAFEGAVSTWFERRVKAAENPYGSVTAVSYLYRLARLDVTIRNGAQHATSSAKDLVKLNLLSGALLAYRVVYDKAVTAPVKLVSIRVRQRHHETGKIFVAASADVKRSTWDMIVSGGRFAVKPDRAALLAPRYSAWMTEP